MHARHGHNEHRALGAGKLAKRGASADLRIAPRGEAHKVARIAIVALLAMCLAFMLGGCKDSKALTELIPDQTSDNIDYDNPEKIFQEYTGEERDDIVPRELTEAERVMAERQTITEYDEQPADGQSPEYDSKDAVVDDSEATRGEDAGNQSKVGTNPTDDASASGPGSGPNTDSSASGGPAGDGGDGGSVSDGEQTSPRHGSVGDGNSAAGDSSDFVDGPDGAGGGEGEDGNPSPGPNDETPTGRIYDPNGPTDELPDDVSYIAATGQYALMVQMLAGGGTYNGTRYASALAAADSDFLSGKAASIYAGEGIGNVAAAWSGDGKSSSQLDLSSLLNLAKQGKLQCVLVGSEDNSLEQSDADALYDAGVSVVVMPSLRTDEGITKSVQIVGKLLEDVDTCEKAKGHGTTTEMAAEYVQQHDEAIDKCKDTNGGFALLYFAGGDTSTALLQPGAPLDGDGWASMAGAMSASEHGSTLWTVYLEDWTTTDYFAETYFDVYSGAREDFIARWFEATVISDGETNGIGLARTRFAAAPYSYYLQAAGVMNLTICSAGGLSATASYVGIDPDIMLPVAKRQSRTNMRNWAVTDHLYVGEQWGVALWGKTGDSWSDNLVGGSLFPAVIVKDANIASRVQRSSVTERGMYNVGQQFDVFVMPSGMLGSWGEGGVESFLISPWAYSMFHAGGDAGQAEAWADKFYETFMRTGYSSVVDDMESVYSCG